MTASGKRSLWCTLAAALTVQWVCWWPERGLLHPHPESKQIGDCTTGGREAPVTNAVQMTASGERRLWCTLAAALKVQWVCWWPERGLLHPHPALKQTAQVAEQAKHRNQLLNMSFVLDLMVNWVC